MNPPTEFGRVAFETSKKNKRALIDYTTRSGRGIKYVMNQLLDGFLSGEIRLPIDNDANIGRAKNK